jgi:hypothetical protein
MEGMNGQWLGRYTGTNSGTIIIELDDMGTHYEGRAFAYDDNISMPSTFALIKTDNKESTLHLNILLYPIDHRTGNPTTWNELAALFPGSVFPTTASVDLNLSDTTLKVSWTTNIGTSGSAEITRKRADDPTDYQPLTEVTKWEEFKSYVCSLEHRRYIFRGQSKLLRLRTTFHRTGRADLARFLEEALGSTMTIDLLGVVASKPFAIEAPRHLARLSGSFGLSRLSGFSGLFGSLVGFPVRPNETD